MNQTETSQLAELAPRLEGELLLDDLSRAVYATAACMYRIEPLGIVLPRHANDVISTVRFCRERGLPIIARGGGSGLAGQSVGRGVIIDFTRYMDALVGVQPEKNIAVVQPGITLGTLNSLLKAHGKYFPPDPSSGNYASLGGMIANNSSGPHSLKYGATIDYVRRLRVVIDTGEVIVAESRPLDGRVPADGRTPSAPTREAELYAGAADIARRYAPLIPKWMPRTSKNSSGYRLDRAIGPLGHAGRVETPRWGVSGDVPRWGVSGDVPPARLYGAESFIHLQRLLCGSEGTLGIVVEAELEIADPPACVELAVLAFRDLQSAADAVPEMMKYGPSAIEAMDSNAAGVVRDRRPELRKFLPPDAAMLIFVEFDGLERPPLVEKATRLRHEILDERKLAFCSVDAADAREQALLWAVRKAVLPILYNMPGPKRVQSFIEDMAVPVAAIPKYMSGLAKILTAHDAPFAVFGHAGEGNFHVRPMLDLSDPAEVQKMATVAEEVFGLVVSLGGTVSGEHGDGLVRSEFLRRLYGDLYPAFEEVKKLFDPAGILNPGKIVGMDQTLCDNLKFGPQYAASKTQAAPARPATELVFADGEYERLVEKCLGCGTCRTLTSETSMCPIYKATRDERLSPRGKVAALREMLGGNLALTPATRGQFDRMIELCLNCGMCTAECPTLAEVPLLINEARARRARDSGVPLLKRLISLYPRLSRPVPAALNAVGAKLLEVKPLRSVIEKLTGIDRRRSLPAIRPARRVREARVANPRRRAALFADLFASLHDPELIRCAMAILEHNEVDTLYPKQRECGVVAMTAGDLPTVRKLIDCNLASFGPLAADGRSVLCTEPTAALCLRREWKHFTPDPAAATVAAQTREFFEFLRELRNAQLLKTDFKALNESYAYHMPCHLAAMKIGQPSVEILGLVPGLKVTPLTRRCCGMAGSFGIAASHYDLSNQIGRPLFDDIRAAARSVLTECSMCAMQIKEQTGVDAVHPIKVLHRAYGLAE